MFDRLFGKLAAPLRTMGAEEGDVLSRGQVLEKGKGLGGHAVRVDGESHKDDVVALDAFDLLNGAEFFFHMNCFVDGARELFSERVGKLARSPELGRQLLGVMDFLWMNHLEDIEALTEAVRIRAYGQKDPIVEYRRESFNLFNAMMANFDGWVFSNLFRISEIPAGDSPKKVGLPAAALAKVGRNDPCPCGSGKKYKKCHGG